MKRIRIAVPAVAVLALAVVVAGCGSSSTHGEEGTVKLIEPGGESGKTFGLVGHASKKVVEPGNGFAFSTPLEDSSGKTVGELNAVCIATKPSPGEGLNGTCSGTAAVPGGGFALNVGGQEIGNNVGGAIVGGTGKYAGAVGTFSSKANGSGENAAETLTFSYTLP
jgi:hypothetical protein